jgi:hypothetical protein
MKIAFRSLLFLCGVVSLLFTKTFTLLDELDATKTWVPFMGALALVGVLAIIGALLPTSWTETLCNIPKGDSRSYVVPFKTLAAFAATCYVVTAALDLLPLSSRPDPRLVLSLCPSCTLMVTIDPSLKTVLTILAPLNAAIYGALGAVLGYLFLAIRNRVRQ